MKRFIWLVPALLVSGGFLIWYRIGVVEEDRLRKTWVRMEMRSRESAEEDAGKKAPIHDSAQSETQSLELDSPEKREAFLAYWAGVVRDGQQQNLDAGKGNEEKFAPYIIHSATMAPKDLYALCQMAPEDANWRSWRLSGISSDDEIRRMLFYYGYAELAKMAPELALQLPQNQPGAKYDGLYDGAIYYWAKLDPDAAWNRVLTTYGGKEASRTTISALLHGAGGKDVSAKFSHAEQWGILDRAVAIYPDEAAQSAAGQEVWLQAFRKTSLPDKELQLARFSRELETSEGFAGVQRLIGKMAEPGSVLYDSILREAAGRDLEEGAGAKADWILAQVSPAAAAVTAETLLKQWTGTDPLSASEWLNAVPRSAPWRRAAILAFVRGIEPHDPEAAAQWRHSAETP